VDLLFKVDPFSIGARRKKKKEKGPEQGPRWPRPVHLPRSPPETARDPESPCFSDIPERQQARDRINTGQTEGVPVPSPRFLSGIGRSNSGGGEGGVSSFLEVFIPNRLVPRKKIVQLSRGENCGTIRFMPTEKKRLRVIPDNLPANLDAGELCPSNYTADTVFEKEPDKYARIAQGLSQGKSALAIAKEEKVATETVAVIMKREKDAIDGAQKLTQGLTSVASQVVLTKIIEQASAGKIPPGALGITFGVLRDKEKADLGQAQQVVEVKKTASLEDVKGHLEALRAERDADIIEVDDAKLD